MTDLPPAYYDDIRRMDVAARAWFKARPFAEPRFRLREFEADMKRQANVPEDANVAISAPLDESVIARVADNADGADLLRAMDRATEGRASYLQAKVLLELAMEQQVKRGQHHLPGGDAWRCPCCDQRVDGVTMLDGSGPPPPGTVGVCFYCGGLQRVNATATGFDPMTEEELRAMPKGLRMQVHDARNAIHKRIAQEARRS